MQSVYWPIRYNCNNVNVAYKTFYEILHNVMRPMLDCHVNDPKTRNGSQQDLNVVVVIKADSIGNGLKAIVQIMKIATNRV